MYMQFGSDNSDDEVDLVHHRRPLTPTPQSNVYQMQRQRYEVFKEQDFDNGGFDFTFIFDDKKVLYVHKFAIMPVSDTFNSMLSIRWSKDAKSAKVENYSYDDFFQFISFLYSGECKLTKENIFALTDMAEYYGVPTLKILCDIFLSKMVYDIEGIYDMIVFGERYSLKEFNRSLHAYFLRHFDAMINAEKFYTLDKAVIEILATFSRRLSHYEELFFEAVCKWAEHKALSNSTDPNEEGFVLQEAIKSELTEILPHIYFPRMSFSFLSHFIVDYKFLFSPSKLYRILCNSKRNDEEQELFEMICDLAEKNVNERMRDDLNIVFTEAMKMELNPLIPRIDFSLMRFSFLKTFLEDKQFLFSPYQLYKIFSKSRKLYHEESEAFETVYELAYNQALDLRNSTSSKHFNLHKAIRNEMNEVLQDFDYSHMSFEFVMSFVVSKKFLFTVQRACKILLYARKKDEEEKCFDAVYAYVESDAKKRLPTVDPGLHLNDIIKDHFRIILNRFKFYRMSLNYMIDNIVEKRSFIFDPSDLYMHLYIAQRDPNVEKRSEQEENFFKAIYELAEKVVLKRQRTVPVENFDLKAAVKQELTDVRLFPKFIKMRVSFLVEFVVKKGYNFTADELYFIFQDFRDRYGNEEELFEAIYQLAEAQAKEKISIDKNLNLIDTIKGDLAITLPNVQFYKMTKTFLADFVVKNGIISQEEADHVFDYRLVVENRGRLLTGAFVDTFGIKDAIGSQGHGLRVLSNGSRQRFTRIKLQVPTTQSSIQKKEGVNWYLVIEKNGTLALAAYYNLSKSDYIVAEMRSESIFDLSRGSFTLLKSYFEDDTDGEY